MAASSGISGFGVTLSISDTSGGSYTAVGEILGVTGPGISMDPVELTHASSDNGFRERVSGLADAGEITFDINFVKAQMTTLYGYIRTTKWWKVTLPDSGSTWVCAGQITGIENEAPIDDRVTASITVQLTGKPTFTAGA